MLALLRTPNLKLKGRLFYNPIIQPFIWGRNGHDMPLQPMIFEEHNGYVRLVHANEQRGGMYP